MSIRNNQPSSTSPTEIAFPNKKKMSPPKYKAPRQVEKRDMYDIDNLIDEEENYLNTIGSQNNEDDDYIIRGSLKQIGE